MKISEYDKKQQNLLRKFDQEMLSYTGQITWFLPGLFAFMVLILSGIPFSAYEKDDYYMCFFLVFLTGMIVVTLLLPYEWCNEFGTRRRKEDMTYHRLKYVPISKKNYIRVRMGYLFRYLWKLCAIALVIQFIVALVSKSFHLENFIYVLTCLFVIPMAYGWIQLKTSLFSKSF